MPAGRPTKYNEEILEKTRVYISGAYKEGEDFEPVPTFEGLSLYIGIHKDTLYDWAKDEDKEEFSDELGKLKATQARGLMRGGLLGGYNATIAKLLLHGHGFSDQAKTTIAGDPTAPLQSSLQEEDREIIRRHTEALKASQ